MVIKSNSREWNLIKVFPTVWANVTHLEPGINAILMESMVTHESINSLTFWNVLYANRAYLLVLLLAYI
jgi:hypothetical protein